MPRPRKTDSEIKRMKKARRKRYESSHKPLYLKLKYFEKLQRIAQREKLTIGGAAAVVIDAYYKKDLDSGRLDMGVLDDMDDEDDGQILSMTCQGEDEVLLVDVNRYPEKPSNERGGNPSLEISYQVPGLLHEGDTQHQLNTDTEGCTNKLNLSASGETNGNKSPSTHIDANAKSVTLNQSTSKALSGSKVRSYSCSVCSKRFGRNDALTRHMLIHAAARPFHCPICNKAFARREPLALHMETSTHRTGPPTCAACSICNKTCSVDALARHMRSHAIERPHRCGPCGKLFLKKEHLSLHMQTHARKEPFQCSICDKTFPVQANLDMHHYLAHTLEASNSKTEHSAVIDVTF